MKTITRTSDATKTTTAIHTVLVRVRIPPGSDEVGGETSVAASEEDPGSVLCVSRSSESMARLTLPLPQPNDLIGVAHRDQLRPGPLARVDRPRTAGARPYATAAR